MKIDFYLDYIPGMNPMFFIATTNPPIHPPPDATRFTFTVDISSRVLDTAQQVKAEEVES